MCWRNFFHSQRVVASQRCMASEHYFLLVALVFFRMSSVRGSRAFPRVFAQVMSFEENDRKCKRAEYALQKRR